MMNNPQVQLLVILIQGRFDAARKDERGVSAVEWVVISGLVAGLAILIYQIMRTRLTDTAENIELEAN